MSFQPHRPPGYTGKGDKSLPRLADELERVLAKTQQSLEYDTLCLPRSGLEDLAGILVEFAEDVHNNIGIWNSIERYNTEFFGTPLPFVLKPTEAMGEESINEHRVQHLLWVLYSEVTPQLLLSPTHRDLKQLAETVSDFLKRRFAKIPRGSSVKKFLSQPNRFGWDVKRKLIWLGTHSYLFRNSFRNYVEDHGGKPEIPIIDDFVCEKTTGWSGLGVVDILASMLDISEEQRLVLRGWCERHQAYYRILTNKGQILEAVNVINDKPYTVRISADKNQFEVGRIVFGALIPWNGEWYWSGTQYALDNVTEEALKELKDTFGRKYPEIAYRYCSELAEKAKQANALQYQGFINYHGNDLVIYPNGLAMAADRQKEIRLQWESKPKEIIVRAIEEHKLKGPQPDIPFPRDLLESENGVAVYYNPDEGTEIMTGFSNIVSGFKKKGTGLNKEEEKGIRSFIWSNLVSPKFVRRLAREHGSESIEAAFLIRGSHDESHVDYLLRRFKGAYYRRRYPRIALV
ncbi:MAG: DUF3843 family protein [Dehalococcoidia bacterium]